MNKSIKIAISGLVIYCASLISQVVAGADAPSAKTTSPIDITGYWVALVTEDWRFRMVTAPAGDHEGINLTKAGLELAAAWNPEADSASGNECKAYGVGGIMRIPTRLHIAWESDNVLIIETDAGKQKRYLHFGPEQVNPGGKGSLQGVSLANWELQREGRFGPVVNGSLAVSTTDMSSGYLRRNGLPYSEQTQVNEFFDLLASPNGTEYLTVLTEIIDPQYLIDPMLTSTSFKREVDGGKWDPRDCQAQ
jgi:hypothetical protein